MFPLISEKAVEEAVRNCEQLKRREQEEDNVTFGELEKQRVEALEVVEKDKEICSKRRRTKVATLVVWEVSVWSWQRSQATDGAFPNSSVKYEFERKNTLLWLTNQITELR